MKPQRDVWRHLRRLLPVAFAVAVTALLGSEDAWAKEAAAAPAPAQAAPAPQNTTKTAPAMELAGEYASREASTPGLENFEGGSVVIITTTGVVIVLLVIIIILLL